MHTLGAAPLCSPPGPGACAPLRAHEPTLRGAAAGVADEAPLDPVDVVCDILRDVESLTPELIAKLTEAGVATRDDLADLAVDELTEITGQSEDEAKAQILKAREHWFTNEAASQE